MTPRRNTELLRLGVEAFNRRDVEGFKSLFAPDAEIIPFGEMSRANVGRIRRVRIVADRRDAFEAVGLSV
jgi:ketosteroid isomerase-like protein